MGCCGIERVEGDFSEEELKKFYGDGELKDCCKDTFSEGGKKSSWLVGALAILLMGIIVIGLII